MIFQKFSSHTMTSFLGVMLVAGIAGSLNRPTNASEPPKPPPLLRIGGSWSGYRSLTDVATEFRKAHRVQASVRGAANRRGFDLLSSDEFDVLVYSPQIDIATDEAIKAPFGEHSCLPRKHLFGQYIVLVIVHPSNPVRALTFDDLRQIYSGKAKEWKAVDGGVRDVIPVGEKPHTKGSELFRNAVNNGEKLPKHIQRFSNGNRVAAYVAANRGAIGFCLREEKPFKGVIPIAIAPSVEESSVPPREDKILARQYPLTEDLLLFTQSESTPLAENFVEFACGPEGAKIARKHFLFAGHDLITADARVRRKIVRSGRAPVVRCAGVPDGRQLMAFLNDAHVFYERAIKIEYESIGVEPSAELIVRGITASTTIRANELELGRRTLAVIIHPENDLEEFLLTDLKMIYEGGFPKWPGQTAKLQMYGPKDNGSVSELFRDLIGAARRKVPYETRESTEEIIRAVARDKAAIGVVDLSQFPADNDRVRLVPVTIPGNKMRPIVAGQPVSADYPLARTYTLCISPNASQEAKDFVRFLTPSRLKEVLTPHGLLPPELANSTDGAATEIQAESQE